MTERSPYLYAYLSYRDAPAALHWFTALGFETVRQQAGDEPNTILHAEVRLGDVVLMIASFDQEYERAPLRGRSTGQGLYILTDDVAGFYRRALSAGGQAVFPPEQTGWGTERARVLDLEGYEWSFGSYQPGSSW